MTFVLSILSKLRKKPEPVEPENPYGSLYSCVLPRVLELAEAMPSLLAEDLKKAGVAFSVILGEDRIESTGVELEYEGECYGLDTAEMSKFETCLLGALSATYFQEHIDLTKIPFEEAVQRYASCVGWTDDLSIGKFPCLLGPKLPSSARGKYVARFIEVIPNTEPNNLKRKVWEFWHKAMGWGKWLDFETFYEKISGYKFDSLTLKSDKKLKFTSVDSQETTVFLMKVIADQEEMLRQYKKKHPHQVRIRM